MSSIGLANHFTYKKLIRFVLPCVIMMVITSLYTIVDGFFVSNFVGKNAFAALNLIWPFLMLLGGVSFMIGSGGSALIAYTLGEGNEDKANRIFTMLVYVLVVTGIILSAIGFVFMRPIAKFLGASEHMIDDCVLYGRILLCSNTFLILQNAYQSFLVTAEKPHLGLALSIIAGVTNMILDFLLVYVYSWGIWGAALATAFSQFLGGIIPSIYFSRKNSSRLKFVKTSLDLKALASACGNGSSEMMTNLSSSIVSLLYNYQLLALAAENGVAAYGAIMYIAFTFSALFFGYAIGSTPIFGFHCGAGNSDELKSLLKKSLRLTLFVGIAMTTLSALLAPVMGQIFVGYDRELYEMTVHGLRIYAFTFLLSGFNIFASAFFTGLNNGKVSALISFLRTLVFQVISIFALPAMLGLTGVWLASVVAEGVTLIVSAVLIVVNRHKYHYL